MIVGSHKGRVGHTWRLHHGASGSSQTCQPLPWWPCHIAVTGNWIDSHDWNLEAEGESQRLNSCDHWDAKRVDVELAQASAHKKSSVSNARGPNPNELCSIHETHAIAIGMAGITISACLIQGKTMHTPGESDHWTLCSPGSLQCLILSESSWSKIWDSHGPSRPTEIKKPTGGIPPCTRAVRSSHSPKLDLTPDTSCTKRKSRRKRMPFSCYDHCHGCYQLPR